MSANKPPQTARMAARDQAAALRAQQIARDKRKRMLLIGLLIVGLLAFILVAYLIIQAGKDKPLDDLTSPSDSGSSAPANVREDGGISFGEDLAAGTDNGEDAVELATYLDFTCGACGQFEETNAEDMNAMLGEGETTLVVYPVSILSNPFSASAAAATYYLADKSPEHVLDFINGVFTDISATQTIPTDDRVEQIALDAGVDQDVADKMLDGTWKKWVTAVTNDVVEREPLQRPEGGFATPTVTVNGTRVEPDQYNWTIPGQIRVAVEDARAGN